MVPRQGCALDLLEGLQHSADPLLISSCLQHKKRCLVSYKLKLEHKNSGLTKCLEKSLVYRMVFFLAFTTFLPICRTFSLFVNLSTEFTFLSIITSVWSIFLTTLNCYIWFPSLLLLFWYFLLFRLTNSIYLFVIRTYVHKYQTQLCISRKLTKSFLWITSVGLNFRYWNFSHRRKPWLHKDLLHC